MIEEEKPKGREMVPIVIMGMHRSGTSAVAGVLSRLGVDMGTDLVPASASQPAGYYEDREVVEINDQILAEAGGSWDDPPAPLDLHNLFHAGGTWVERIAGYHRRRLEAGRIWGMKDPRLCLTFPAWLGEMGAARVVEVTRYEGDIVASLMARNGGDVRKWTSAMLIYKACWYMSRDRMLTVASQYIAQMMFEDEEAEHFSNMEYKRRWDGLKGEMFQPVSYENLVEARQTWVTILANWLNWGRDLVGIRQVREAIGFIDRSLNHGTAAGFLAGANKEEGENATIH